MGDGSDSAGCLAEIRNGPWKTWIASLQITSLTLRLMFNSEIPGMCLCDGMGGGGVWKKEETGKDVEIEVGKL